MKIYCPNCHYDNRPSTFRPRLKQHICPNCRKPLLAPEKRRVMSVCNWVLLVMLVISLTLAISGLVDMGVNAAIAFVLCLAVYLVLYALIYPLLVRLIIRMK